MKRFFKNYWQLIIVNILVLLCFTLGYGRFGNIIVDSFREAYIPELMLQGKTLYKDIFTIYCPLAYNINAFLMLVFGAKLKVLYFAGFIATTGILNLTFLILTKFTRRTYALSAVLFVIAASVLSANVFNMFFPYSFGILYGVLFCLASIYCALNNSYFASYIFCSLALCSKYEFIFFLPLLFWMSGKKNLCKNIIGFFIPIIFTLLSLFLQGNQISDLIFSIKLVVSMASTKTLYWFYSIMGLVFRPQIIPLYIINILKYSLPLIFIKYIKKWWTLFIVILYLYFAVNQEILIYIFPLILILLIVRFKHMSKNMLFAVLSSLFLSAKVFFALTLESYGVFFIPFALICLFILMPPKFKKSLSALILCSALILASQNIIKLSLKNIKIKTDRGVIYANKYEGCAIRELVEYVAKNTKKTDKVVVYPEGLSVNFLTNRSSDTKFYSLIPLNVELFGEDLIIKRLELIKPKYIVVSNSDMSNYYFSFFGQDYAEQIYDYIQMNYELDVQIDEGLAIRVFKRKH